MHAEFRLARVREVDGVVGFGYTVVPQYFAPLLGEQVSKARLSEWSTHHMQSAIDRARVHLAVVDDAVVGVCETGELAREEVLWKLYVDADFRGHGLGSELLRQAIAALPEDADHLLVSHFAGNDGAARFFEHAGFEVVGTEPPVFDEPESAMVWRRLDLET